MTRTFHKDLASSQEAIRLARDELLRVIDSLNRADLERARKGGWTIARVLEHIIHSENLYAQATAYLVGTQAVAARENSTPSSTSEARRMLLDGRKALLGALAEIEVDPMGYETFYEIKKMGHEEYSVLSVLENVASHDREHAEQVRSILADTRE
jgi:uncharacterized damage-inducible protein DinB